MTFVVLRKRKQNASIFRNVLQTLFIYSTFCFYSFKVHFLYFLNLLSVCKD